MPKNPTMIANSIPLLGNKHNRDEANPKTSEIIPNIVTVFFMIIFFFYLNAPTKLSIFLSLT